MNRQRSSKAAAFRPAHELRSRDFEPGFVLTEVATSRYYKTGDWRSKRPVWDNNRCIQCGLCYIYCPDMAVRRRPDGFFEANLDYCKGCGICAQECFTKCIEMVDER